jgi:glutathione S-transferase
LQPALARRYSVMMWQLYQFPLCPFSRKVRLLLGEKGVGYELVKEYPWERRDEFIDMNPAGQTPVMVDVARASAPLIDSTAICEYVEETVDKAAMINGTAANRAEIRRLVTWFDTQFYRDVTQLLLHERVVKRIANRSAPDARGLRDAMKGAVGHLDYIDYLLDHRNWLAGATMSLADLAAAAQISVTDYLGGIDWKGHDQTARWYRGLKSRPAFRPLLSERMEMINPPAHYDNVDF